MKRIILGSALALILNQGAIASEAQISANHVVPPQYDTCTGTGLRDYAWRIMDLDPSLGEGGVQSDALDNAFAAWQAQDPVRTNDFLCHWLRGADNGGGSTTYIQLVPNPPGGLQSKSLYPVVEASDAVVEASDAYEGLPDLFVYKNLDLEGATQIPYGQTWTGYAIWVREVTVEFQTISYTWVRFDNGHEGYVLTSALKNPNNP